MIFSEKPFKNHFSEKIKIFIYTDSFEAVFTYKIRRKEVGIMINNAVAVNPKILTSIKNFKKIFCDCLKKKAETLKNAGKFLHFFQKQFFS